MQIIRRGILPSEEEYELTCDRCKTVFRFAKSEGEEIKVGGRSEEVLVKIKCPLCRNSCLTNENKNKVKKTLSNVPEIVLDSER